MRKTLDATRVGSTLRDRNGVVWTVAEKTAPRGNRVLIQNEDAAHWLDSSTEVEVIEEPIEEIPGVDPLELAEYRVTAMLGGEKVASIVKGTKHYAPANFDHVGSMLAHLAVMHGMDVTDAPQTMAELRVIHSTDHSEHASGQYIQHVHNDARFYGRAEVE